MNHLGIYEVHLPVSDLKQSIDFYTNKLGFEMSYGKVSEGSVLLTCVRDAKKWMLGLFQVDRIVHRHPAEYHISFRFDSSQAENMISYLKERGIHSIHPPNAPEHGEMSEPIVHGWMPAAAVFFKDPDGHLLELIADLDEPARPENNYTKLSEWRKTSKS